MESIPIQEMSLVGQIKMWCFENIMTNPYIGLLIFFVVVVWTAYHKLWVQEETTKVNKKLTSIPSTL